MGTSGSERKSDQLLKAVAFRETKKKSFCWVPASGDNHVEISEAVNEAGEAGFSNRSVEYIDTKSDDCHAPAWKFPDLPTEGTLVMAMIKHKSNFKRGVILRVEIISNTRFYFVFLYDWGILERFTIDELAQLRAEDEHKLLPRSFFVIHAGMVECRTNFLSRARRESTIQVENETEAETFGEDGLRQTGTNRSTVLNSFEVQKFARNWFDSRDCYMQMYKNFEGIVFICDLRTPMIKENGRVKDVAFAYLMESKGFTFIDRKLRKQDKDYALSNWESIVGRLEGINFDDVTKTKDNNSERQAASCDDATSEIDSDCNEQTQTSRAENTSR
ncbi:unnamed protein product [Allacma fusca]|uniref:Uncharacterized protein n=1 Tax=Allacma fusca TaxID=39272 RepID=A0A8J2M1T1_9HEXA|nr:unnamed protein product [Allacma fusca]